MWGYSLYKKILRQKLKHLRTMAKKKATGKAKGGAKRGGAKKGGSASA